MKALNISPDDFIRSFFEPDETVCLRVFDDRRTGTFKGLKLECKAAEIDAIADKLRRHNARMRGIFFTVNYGGHEDSEITRVNAQFVECDTLSFEEQEQNLRAFPLEPSLVVKTRKSLHSYWLVRNGDTGAFRRIQKQLAAQFHGDPVCVNESRVMRMPGFFHCKDEPVMVECVKFNPDLRYTQAELSAALPPVPGEVNRAAAPPKGSRKGLSSVMSRCDFIRHCGENAASLSEHDWYAMITNLAVFEGAEAQIHALSKGYPGYSRTETQDKISHFLDSGTKPITCRTIAEKGFSCPKLGVCSCKSPAALCFQPMNTDELAAVLNEIEVSDDAVKNAESALGFISGYLYCTEPGVAEAFIAYAVKEHFGFRASDLKPLTASYREAHKKFTQSSETRREASGREIPEWYELTDGGGMRFIPGILAKHMAQEVRAFYAAEQYYVCEGGVYSAQSDLYAKNMVRALMLPRYTTLGNITDAEGQWRIYQQ